VNIMTLYIYNDPIYIGNVEPYILHRLLFALYFPNIERVERI